MDDMTIAAHGSPVSQIYFRASLDDIGSCISGRGPVFIVCDRNVSGFADKVASRLSPVSVKCLDTSEETKTLETVADICDWLLESGADRNALLLAVGGGILTDMAGFAAAIYKRGIRTAYVPTTLLAQVDASIGGKTGVNFHDYKNILGVIRQPVFTYVCPEVLLTLPYAHLLEGVAEMLKTFIIKDEGNYSKAVEFFSSVHSSHDPAACLASGTHTLSALVRAAASVKTDIVSRDQFEGGLRRVLNLGHTFAHAVEWHSHRISHGQAVSIGMVCAAELSRAKGICPDGLPQKITSDLASCGLQTRLPFPLETLCAAMEKDKKAEDGMVHFILIRGIGDVTEEKMTVGDAVKLLKSEK